MAIATKRVVAEMIVFAAAVALTIGIASLIAPGPFPNAASQSFVAEKHAQLVALPAGIVVYALLQRQYRLHRRRRRASSS